MGSDGELLGERAYVWGSRWDKRHYFNYGYIPIENGNSSEDKIWTRFSILHNVEGQKYTIGNSFTSREEQGELIFWFKDYEEYNPDRKQNPICEIIVEDNKFWITSLKRNAVSLNDVQLKGSTRTEIKFGDYLSLGGQRNYSAGRKRNRDEIWRVEPCPTLFWFKERALVQDRDKDGEKKVVVEQGERSSLFFGALGTENPTLAVGTNSLILSQILSYLPTSCLKSMRLVCSIWNEEAVKLLKRKYQVHFKFDQFLFKSKTLNPDESKELFQFVSEMSGSSGNSFQNLRLDIPSFHFGGGDRVQDDRRLNLVDISTGSKGDKFLSDLNWFFSPNRGMCIKILTFGGTISSRMEFELRIKAIQAFQSTLEELELSDRWEGPGSFLDDGHSSSSYSCNMDFRRLQRFAVDLLITRSTSAANATFRTWLVDFIPAMRSLRALSLKHSDATTTLLPNLNSFPNLEEIALNSVSSFELQFLLGCKKGLKKLELNELKPLVGRDADFVQDLETLFRKHAETLESLQFVVTSLAFLQFPVLPKLTHLEIVGDKNLFRMDLELYDFPGPAFLGMNYAQHLPALQSLTLCPDYSCSYSNFMDNYNQIADIEDINQFWNDYVIFFNAFFPVDSLLSGSTTLLYLDIPFEDVYNRTFSRALELSNRFPNCWNEWMTEARAGEIEEAPEVKDNVNVC